MMRTALLLAGAALALGACSTPLDAPLQENFGQAVASMDAQIVPAAVSDAPPEGSGAQAAAALKRYETDKVKKPPLASTSTIVIGGGGGSDDTASSGASQ